MRFRITNRTKNQIGLLLKSITVIAAYMLIQSNTLYAQNNSDLKRWFLSVEEGFNNSSDSALYRAPPDSRRYKQIRYNLISDRFFIDVFGLPYDELSKQSLKAIHDKIIKIKASEVSSPKGEKDWKEKLFWYTWGLFNGIRHNEGLVRVKSLREIRGYLENDLERIKNGEVKLLELIDTRKANGLDYFDLMPSELTSLYCDI